MQEARAAPHAGAPTHATVAPEALMLHRRARAQSRARAELEMDAEGVGELAARDQEEIASQMQQLKARASMQYPLLSTRCYSGRFAVAPDLWGTTECKTPQALLLIDLFMF